MQRNNPTKIAVTFRTKIALVIFGIFLSLLILEIGLHLAGFLLLSVQEYRNWQSIKQKGAYRIMCLGESTTQNQYSSFLEAALNQRKAGIQFSVIDKGVGGTNTPTILKQLESNLKECNPDMVVAMMGINDCWGPHIPYEAATTSKITLFLKSFRTYKLVRLLWLHIVVKTKELGFSYLPTIRLKEAYAEPVSSEDTLKKAIELNPKNDNAYVELGCFYQIQLELFQTENAFKKAIELNPKNDNAYVGLGLCYQNQLEFSQAENAFKKAIELNPKNDNDNAYIGLGWCYHSQLKFSQAENAFKKAIELKPESDRAYGACSLLYEEIGKPELAREYAKKAHSLRLAYYNPLTVQNYHKLKEILDKRGIKLVCVQYPMRSIEPLKKIFKDDAEGVIFVDNAKIFRDAIKNDGFNAFFVDMFGGDFGHCTKKGNRLLAENIANTILREVFNK